MNKHSIRRNIIYRGYMLSKAFFASRNFVKQGGDFYTIWVTGTDGKSTTCSMIYHLLKEQWFKVWIISTVLIDVGQWIKENQTHMTSLDHKIFWEYVIKAKKQGITHLVVEVTSHALFQYRTWPMKFDAVACTNITREHLDFHKTMWHYVSTKAELFKKTKPWAIGILKQWFSYTDVFANKSLEIQTFWSTDNADIWVDKISNQWSLSFHLHDTNNQFPVTTKIVGEFNTENMMIATLIAKKLWISLQEIVNSLKSYPWLAWRQELVLTQQWITAMVDFALTPDWLKTLYESVRKMWYNKLIAIFGATGNRDQGKRPKMGKIAWELCDRVILTEDENYHEDGMAIMQHVEQWVKESQWSYELVQDRTNAIRRWLEIAQSWDIVIVTGMANFKTRSMNEWSIPWNEREVIETQMKELWLVPVG